MSACTGGFDELMAAIDITFYVGLQGKEFLFQVLAGERHRADARANRQRAAGSVVVSGDEVSQLRN